MDKKVVLYIGLAVGIVLIVLGGGLLSLKEKNVKKTISKNPSKVEVIVSTQTKQVSSHPQVTTELPVFKISQKQTINQQKRKIAFHYRSSKPKNVYLVGDFNKWNKKANPMKLGKNYVWETMLLLSPGEYKYAFLVDGRRVNDPSNKKTLHLKHGKVSLLKVEPLK